MNRESIAAAAEIRTGDLRKEDLKRELGLGSATAVVAGECIAVGIFLTPAGMAKALGSPMWLLLVWLVVGAMTMSGALCLENCGRFPRAGGSYVYLQEAFGSRVAFLYGWMCLLVINPACQPRWRRESPPTPLTSSTGLLLSPKWPPLPRLARCVCSILLAFA